MRSLTIKSPPKALVLLLLACVLGPARALAQDQAAGNLNSISSVNVRGGTVEIVGTKKPNFTTFTLTDPPRLVIDISEAVFSGVKEDITVGNGTITAIRTASYGSDESAIARVLIGYEREVETDIQARGNSLVVNVAGGAAVAAAPTGTAPAAADSPSVAPAAQPADEEQARQTGAAAQAAQEDQKRQAGAAAQAAQAAQDERKQQELAATQAAEQQRADAEARRQAQARAETERKEQEASARAATQQAEQQRLQQDRAAQAAEKQQQEEARAAAEARRESEAQATEAKKRQAAEERARRESEAQAAAEARQQARQPRVAQAEAPRREPAREGGSPEVSSRRKTMTLVGFKQERGVSRVFVRTNEPVRYSVTPGDKLLVLELENTLVSEENNTRALDTSFFDTAVVSVDANPGPSRTVRVAIRLKQQVPYETHQEGNELSIEFQRPARQ